MQHAGDDHAAARRNAKALGQFWAEFLWLHANPAPGYLAVTHDRLHHTARGGRGNGKTNAHGAARPGVDGGVDTHQMAVHVHQCTARVSRVDGRIGLDEIFKGVDAQLGSTQCADDAPRDGLTHAEGVADGQHLVADGQGI